MVVCKCRKATKLYCFVHKVPVCGECICFPEHQICVAVVEDGADPQTTRLGCLHIIHTNCLVSHIKSFPPHTAPAGYVCPFCSTPLWPPKTIKDSGSRLHSELKDAFMQTGLEKNLFGNHPVSLSTESRPPPPAFASDPLMHISATGGSTSIVGQDARGYSAATGIGSDDIVEIDGPNSLNPSRSNQPNFTKSPAATTRKSGFQVDRQNSELSYYADDEDVNQKKYTRRGTFRHKFLRALIPFWSNTLPTLPVTAPPRKDASNADDTSQGRVRHQKSSRMDPRKILLTIAIMACMATMGILYYRLAQRGFGDDLDNEEQAVM